MKNELIEGIIFRIFDSGTADKVINIATKKGARKAVLAKGVKKSSSKKSHSIEIGNLVKVKTVEGYSVSIATEISVINSFIKWKQDYKKMMALQFIFEVIDKFLVEGVEDEKFYDILFETLEADGDNEKLNLTIAVFLLKILQESGQLPDIRYTLDNEKDVESDNAYFIHNEIGFVSEDKAQYGEKLDQRIYKTQRFILNTNVKTATKVNLQPEEAIKMLKLHLNWIETALDRELKSKKIFLSTLNNI